MKKRRTFSAPWFALALGLAFCGCGHEAPPPPDAGRASEAVRVATVARRDIPVFEEIVGSVQPRYQASISAKIAGRIIRVTAEPGAQVEKDELLAELEVRELESALEGAKATLENAQREQDRYRSAMAGGSVSKSDIDRAESAFRVAQAGYDEIARRIEYAAIKAPFEGVITRRYMDAGDLAMPGEAIYRIEDPTKLRLEIDVAESIAGGISLGRKLSVRVDGANADLEGTVSEAAPSADVGSRTFLVKLDLPAHEHLRAGQFGRAYLSRGTKDTIVIPKNTIVQRGQLDLVYVIKDGRAGMRVVRLGDEIDDGVEVLAGLEEGDSIVAGPPFDLRGGQLVEVLE